MGAVDIGASSPRPESMKMKMKMKMKNQERLLVSLVPAEEDQKGVCKVCRRSRVRSSRSAALLPVAHTPAAEALITAMVRSAFVLSCNDPSLAFGRASRLTLMYFSIPPVAVQAVLVSRGKIDHGRQREAGTFFFPLMHANCTLETLGSHRPKVRRREREREREMRLVMACRDLSTRRIVTRSSSTSSDASDANLGSHSTE
jgi:hypothetical protein